MPRVISTDLHCCVRGFCRSSIPLYDPLLIFGYFFLDFFKAILKCMEKLVSGGCLIEIFETAVNHAHYNMPVDIWYISSVKQCISIFATLNIIRENHVSAINNRNEIKLPR